jgi:hypothetical protein
MLKPQGVELVDGLIDTVIGLGKTIPLSSTSLPHEMLEASDESLLHV